MNTPFPRLIFGRFSLIVCSATFPLWLFLQPAQAQNQARPQRTPTSLVPLAPLITGPITLESVPVQQWNAIAGDANYETLAKLADQALGVSARELPKRTFYCRELASRLMAYNFGPNREKARQLARQLAFATFATSDERSWLDEIKMVNLILETPEPDPQQQRELWRAQRFALAQATLHITASIKATIEPGPPKKVSIWEKLIPEGVGGIAGMSPDEVSDPLLRALYRQKLNAYEEKVQQAIFFHAACEQEPAWLSRAETILTQLLAPDSIEPRQARELVETADIDPGLKARLLARLAEETNE